MSARVFVILRLIVPALALMLVLAHPALAQNRFAPVVRVGDGVVTRYQLDQRTLFLSLLRAPGDPRDLAREQLINEAIQMSAARDAGLEPSAEEVDAGLSEFAARADLTAEEFVTALQQNGVGPETFRDFVAAGVAWRNYVRQRFGDTARDIQPSLVQRTLASTGTEGGLRVLVSEIILPANSPETAAASRKRANDLAGIEGEDAFAAAARRFSIAPSSIAGGALNWAALETLPDEVQPVIAGLAPGQVSRPVELEGSIGLFLLRDEEQVAPGTPETLSIDYALFIASGGPAEAAAIEQDIDVCDDLYGVARGLPEDRLIRETVPVSALPADIRTEIATMDLGETSTALTRAGQSTVLMLCERKAALESTVDIEIIGNRLLNARLGTIAADHLANLRAGMVIVDLTR